MPSTEAADTGSFHVAPASLTLAASSFSPAQVASALLSGQLWSGGTITFSFPAAGAAWPGYDAGSEPFVGFTALNATHQNAFRGAVAAWDQLIAPSFVEVSDAAPGQIRVGFSSHSSLGGNTAGHAYEPPGPGAAAAPNNGDVWISATEVGAPFTPGTDPYDTFVHELGHAIGLKHSFEGPGPLPAAFENKRYTVMSYTNAPDSTRITVRAEGGGFSATNEVVHASTPMVLDIAAVQQRYGADPTTAVGANTYTFTDGQAFFSSVYDAGGIDTIDLSNLSRGSDVDLAPGSYSSIGYFSAEAQIAALIQQFPGAEALIRSQFASVGAGVYTWSNNFGIAFSTVIENVNGSNANDTITGADADNVLQGSGGDDYIRGLNGNDTVDGGAGNDDVNGNVGVDLVRGGDGADFVRGGRDNDTVYGDAGDDFHVNGNIGDDIVYGGTGNDSVFGGQGNDTLFGEDGADALSGDLGDDLLWGGAGADRFLVRLGAGSDVAGDFSSALGDRVQMAAGTAYTLSEAGGSAVVTLADGARLTLTGVGIASLGDWLVFV